MSFTSPIISIITVVYNGYNCIETTILSVINQTYKNIEYIIIDGGSTDGTINIIKKYENKISYWISEPDKGIYDAMNKGIEVASGEWMNFMNAGDTFADNRVLEKVFDKTYPYYLKVIYGDTIMLGNLQKRLKKANDITKINRYLPFCHQSSFIKNINNNSIKYDLKYRISSDYKMFLNIYLIWGRESFYYLPIAFSVFEAENGISTTKTFNMKEEYLAIRSTNKDPYWYIDFFKLLIKRIIKRY